MDIESLNRLLMVFRLRCPGPDAIDAEKELIEALRQYLIEEGLIEPRMLQQGSFPTPDALAKCVCYTLAEKWRTAELNRFSRAYLKKALWNEVSYLRVGVELPPGMVDRRTLTPQEEERRREKMQEAEEELQRQEDKDNKTYVRVHACLYPHDQDLFNAWIDRFDDDWQTDYAEEIKRSDTWVSNHLGRGNRDGTWGGIRGVIIAEGEPKHDEFVERLHLYKVRDRVPEEIASENDADQLVRAEMKCARVMDKLDKDDRGVFIAWIRYYRDQEWQTRLAGQVGEDPGWVREHLDTIRNVIRGEGEANPDNFVEILHGIHAFPGRPNTPRLDYATQTARLNARFQGCPAILELIRAYGAEGPNQVSPNDLDEIHKAYREIAERFWAANAARSFYQRLLTRRDNLARAIQTVGQQRDPDWLIQANLIVTLSHKEIAFNDLGPQLGGISADAIVDLLLECRDLVNEYNQHNRAG